MAFIFCIFPLPVLLSPQVIIHRYNQFKFELLIACTNREHALDILGLSEVPRFEFQFDR